MKRPVPASRFILLFLALCFMAGPAAAQTPSVEIDLDAAKRQHSMTAEERTEQKRLRQLERSRRKDAAKDKLTRLQGQYGDPEGDDDGHYLYVAVSCDGFLVVGPMWMDLSPWWMSSKSDTEFTYEDAYAKFTLEFVLDENGEVVELVHGVQGMKSPLQRVEPLPNDWGGCLPRRPY